MSRESRVLCRASRESYAVRWARTRRRGAGTHRARPDRTGRARVHRTTVFPPYRPRGCGTRRCHRHEGRATSGAVRPRGGLADDHGVPVAEAASVVTRRSEILTDAPARHRSSARHLTVGTPHGEEYRRPAAEAPAEAELSRGPIGRQALTEWAGHRDAGPARRATRPFAVVVPERRPSSARVDAPCPHVPARTGSGPAPSRRGSTRAVRSSSGGGGTPSAPRRAWLRQGRLCPRPARPRRPSPPAAVRPAPLLPSPRPVRRVPRSHR